MWVDRVRTRLAILSMVGLLIASLLAPAALSFQELELQAATDSLQNAGRTTVDTVFWRSGFGASILGGPSYAGNTTAYNARVAAIEALTGGSTPTGALPLFLEFSDLAGAQYASSSVNASDFTTQRWNFTNGSRVAGAGSLGFGAAAEAAWAAYLLRTNHYPVNGTQDPDAPLIGATDGDGLLGLWLVDGLKDRLTALSLYGAYNGSALTAFNFTDPALNDDNASNGWQLVPEAMGVLLSSDVPPLFQGFSPQDSSTSIAGQAALILGLAEALELADPAGAHAALFDGDPFDASLHANARALLIAVVENAKAAHFDAAASTFTEPGGRVDTGDLALLTFALAAAEDAVDPGLKANMTAARESALNALTSLANPNGVFPGSYDVASPAVTANWSSVTLWSQASALEATARVYSTTGLAAHYDWMFKASAGLESPLFHNGSYHAEDPEPALSTFTAGAVAATIGGLRDLALTGEEPLAIWRLVNATQWLFTAPPLTLAGAQAPPVIGANFVWNATGMAYESGGTDFGAAGALYAAYQFLTVGPEFYAAVGGGVSVTERAARLLHNATATQVGSAIDALDQQIAALQAQVAALQASFDALNDSVTNITDRLNLSLENESISAQRIVDLQANVTSLRAQLNTTLADLSVAEQILANATGNYTELESRFMNVTNNLTAALQNATTLAGRLNQTQSDLEHFHTALDTTNATLDSRSNALARAQGTLALAVVGGMVAGAVLMLFLQRYVMAPKSAAAKPDEPKKGDKGKAESEDADDENADDEDDET